MRPDQHKKKRSNQYKKQHGISDSGAEKGTGKGKKQEKEAKSSRESAQPVEEKHKNKHEEDDEDGHSSEELTDSRTYRRRTIGSNWERYADCGDGEVGADGASVAMRGERFQTLLSNTSEAIAQFKFEDEKDWCENVDSTPEFLKVNCSRLVSRLKCVPLHERLGLSAHLVNDETKEQFLLEAEEHKKKCLDILSNSHSVSSKDNTNIVKEVQVSSNKNVMDQELDNLLDGLPPVGDLKNKSSTSNGRNTASGKDGDEGALDFLLNLSNDPKTDRNQRRESEKELVTGDHCNSVNSDRKGDENKKVSSSTITQHQPSQRENAGDDDLFDFLDNLEDGASSKPKQKTATGNPAKTAEVDVDDFLDDLLS